MAERMTGAERKRSGEARSVPLDSLRGLAVLLMIIDHGLALAGPGWPLAVRLTVTRAALPLFCVVAGNLIAVRMPRPGRLLTLTAAGVGAEVLWGVLGLPGVNPLVLLTAALAAVALCPAQWRLLLLVAAVVQPVTWPVARGGYEPGFVVALVVAGTLVPRPTLEAVGARVPAVFAAPGRFPVTLYLVHLAGLAGLVLGTS